jgi:hypothetical protein
LQAKNRYDDDVERVQREPYVTNLRHPRSGEMKFELEDPYQHRLAFQRFRLEELAEGLGVQDHELLPSDDEPDVLPDGGSRTQYFWSGEDGIAYHTEVGEDMVDPFFSSVDEAERYLERKADQHGKQRYEGLVLRKSGNQKVEEATEVLTEQSGLDQFAPDGGFDWRRVLTEYWHDLKEFEGRHPPRYVDPGKPVDHDSVDYFPHLHFQKGIHDVVGSHEQYEDLMGSVRWQEYGVDPVIEDE